MMTSESARLVWLYEQGQMKNDEAIAMYYRLIKTGEIWQLPEHYIVQATKLIDLQGPEHKGGGQ